MCKKENYLISIFLALLMAGAGQAAIIVAGNLLVDLDASSLPTGPLATWTNAGALGNFSAQGAPVVEDVDGMRTVTFDGTCWFDGPTSVPSIEGADDRSIEIWAYNPSSPPIPGEESTVSWAHRGGPNGTNMSFNYGNHNLWGAVGHWGGDTHDMGWWGTHSPAPASDEWWHLTYTYDGISARVYVNGVEESVRTIPLNTYGGNIIRVGAQANGDGGWADTAFNFTGSIAQVRIHDGALSAADVMNNFKASGPKKARKPNPANGAQNVGRFDNFGLVSWKSGTGALWHHVYFGTNPTPGAGEFRARQPGANVYYMHPTRDPATTYYWRIDEEVASGTKYTGDVWSFTTAPMQAHSPEPGDDAEFVDPNVDLAWGTGFDGMSHDVYFGTDKSAVESAGKTSDEFKGNTADTTFALDTLGAGVDYYWRIDENNSDASVTEGEVWHFYTRPEIPISDPNLVGWWKLDRTGGAGTAIDWSGYERHGTIRGNPEWEPGICGEALKFDGYNDYVDLPIGSLISTLNSATVTTWVDFANAGGAWQRIFDFGSGTGVYMFLCPRIGTGGVMRFAITTGGGGGENIINTASTLMSGWHHVAVTINGDTRNLIVYLDGSVVGTNTSSTVTVSDLGVTTNNWLGRSQYAADGYFMGSLSDFRIYDFAMSQAQLPETMRCDPLQAWNPSPADGSTPDVDQAAVLTWSPGDNATGHHVYLGTDRAAVASADTSTPGIYRGLESSASYVPPEGVEWGASYYWRIDELNTDSSVTKGRVWSFTVADYLIVDDFEDYNDYTPDRIFEAWKDGFGYGSETSPPYYAGNGTGSIVGYAQPPFAETSIVYSGSQAMPYFFDNDMPGILYKYSEATKTLSTRRDWTGHGVRALSMRFRGYPASTGSFNYDQGTQTYTLTGSGADIWDVGPTGGPYHDEFHFAFKTLSGPGTIIARVESVQNTDGWAKAGVMIRDTLDPNSAHSMVVVTPSNGVAWQYRVTAGGPSASAGQTTGITAPHWVKLERDSAGMVTGSHSTDGTTWEVMGTSVSIPMNTPMYIGLCLTSHSAYVTCEAVFSNVSFPNTTPGATWGNQDIGIQSNNPEPMYVAVANSNGTTAVVTNPDPNAALNDTWTEWNVPLVEFSNQGVLLGDVNSVSLGFGTRGNATTPGGAGLVYFDDIRLYRGRCFPSIARPAADFSNNCVVDMPDVEIMVDNWLMSDYEVTPTAPGTSGLVAYYQLENNTLDISPGGHNGDPCGAPTYVAGNVGSWAMHFDGTVVGNYVDTGTWNPSEASGHLSISLWAKWDGLSGYYQGLIAKRDTWNGADMMWQLEANITTGAVGFFREGSYPFSGNPVLPIGVWTHVGVSFDGTTSRFYINGELTGSGGFSFGSDTGSRLVFGACEGGGGNPFNGALDEIRLYNRPLSQGEIAHLAGRTGTFTQPLYLLMAPQDAAIDMNGDGTIDFKDYAALADIWLDVLLWP
ncbi:MAG: LamG domain-containing protein [Phycisphaerales bacterium]|nr:MAG: LamG domain-containing protein [Phycisphaerales bacterium]